MSKTLVISGGTAGIGKQISLSFAQQGFNIIFLTHNVPNVTQLIAELSDTYSGIFTYKVCEIADEQNVAEVFSAISKEVASVDVFINNAGYGPGVPAYPNETITKLSGQQWDTYLDNCLKGIFNCLKVELGMMVAWNKGLIINTVLEPVTYRPDELLYSISKAALIAMTTTVQNTLKMLNSHVQIELVKGKNGPDKLIEDIHAHLESVR